MHWTSVCSGRTWHRLGLMGIVIALAVPSWAAPNREYASVLPKLKAKTRLPILLPSWLAPNEAGHYPQASASIHSYSVDLAYAAGCNGAMACTGLIISGEDATVVAKDFHLAHKYGDKAKTTAQYIQQNYLSGTRVRLRGGPTGYFLQPSAGSADGGSTTLTWIYRGVYYSLQARGSVPQQTMVRCANSALPP